MAERRERLPVTAIVHTRDSAATIERALRTLDWADEILVVDMASSDRTREIASTLATAVHTTPVVPRVDGIRNRWVARARHEWVFVLDSDEWLAEDAAAQIAALLARYGERCDAFAIPRFNWIGGQPMRASGWYPDRQIRLFRKGAVRWSDATHQLPEVLTGRHRLHELTPPDCLHLHHGNYADLREFVLRQAQYAVRDVYPADPAAFDFSDYVARAYQALATRRDAEDDGDASHALALLLAWDQIVRGLLHWDALDPRPPLGLYASLPVATEKVPWWRVRARRWLGRRHALSYYARRTWETYRDWRAR